MNPEMIELVNNSGYKKKHLAKKLDITPAYLTMCMKGRRSLSFLKTQKLRNLLSNED